MSYCHNCGFELPEGASSCPNCGAAAGEGGAAYAYDFSQEEESGGENQETEYTGQSGQYNTQANYQNQSTQNDQRYEQVPPYVDPRRGYTPPRPAYSYVSEEDESNRVLGTGSFLLSQILMKIPVIGLAFQIIWALGGTKSLNRRNLARSNLILTVIGLVLAVLIVTAIAYQITPLIDEIVSNPEYFEGFEDMFEGLFDVFG